jgi:Cu(I)/Ag(I) efflux system membrane fusion protein
VKYAIHFVLVLAITCPMLHGQGIRERIRMSPRGTRLSETQAADVTLTLSPATVRPIQQIVRTGGTIDAARKVVTASVTGPTGAFLKPGLRARAFPPESKSSMYQARVTRVEPRGSTTVVQAELSNVGVEGRLNYVLEIVVERGEFLSVPNEAIIEEGDRRVVYVQQRGGSYIPKTIETGFQGELYTQVIGGLDGSEQVVTFGSFFIDSEYKLKVADTATGP